MRNFPSNSRLFPAACLAAVLSLSPLSSLAQDAAAPATPAEPSAETGEGSLRVCNQTANPVSIAFGFRAEKGWQSEGWWLADPAACVTIFRGNLEARRYYYLYAADDIGGGVWDGDVYMCTRDETFTIFGVEDCLARGYERTGFFEIDTDNKSDWTLQLTEGDGLSGATPEAGDDALPLGDETGTPDAGSSTEPDADSQQ